MSGDVEDLLAEAASAMARRRWRLMGAHSLTEARAYFINALRRRLA